MVKYFKELENKKDFYLSLVSYSKSFENNHLYNAIIPHTFIEKYSDLFKWGESLIKIYDNFDIETFDRNTICSTYEQFVEKNDIWQSFESLKEDMYFYRINLDKIELSSLEIECYLLTTRKIANLFQSLLPHNKELYLSICKRITNALKDLNNYILINCKYEDKSEHLYQPDAWYITPNNYLYNTGSEGHAGRDLNVIYRKQCNSFKKGHFYFDNSLSKSYFDIAKEIKDNDYITEEEYANFLNYASRPMYLDHIGFLSLTRDRNILKLILGIVNAQACMYKSFEDLCIKTNNPKEELANLNKITNDDIRDILVRFCGFHKVESTVDKTITTSLINYEEEFKEYIDKGWTISFVPPIIIDECNHTIKEYPEEFLKIRKLLKSNNLNPIL